jgi:heat-inducible transcriptional repressor
MGHRRLVKRHEEILAAIIHRYVESGAPVGSKSVSGRLGEALSPATVRTCMADLEAAGFLEQPHVSAGRIPTDQAYRLYVDRWMGSGRLKPSTKRYIAESLRSHCSALETLMANASSVLAEVSRNVGVVLGSPLDEKILEHVKFIKLPDCRVLAVIVSKPDRVENKVIRVEEEFSQEDLDRAATYLNEKFRGWSLRAVRLEIFQRLEGMKALSDQVISNLAKLFTWGGLAEGEPAQVFVEGAARMLGQPDFDDMRRARALLAAFEEKTKLARILDACLQTPAAGVRVLIGRENPAREMRQCAVVAAPYRYRNRVVGALGVVGPTRMEYDRAFSTVEYVANFCSRLLSTN